MFDFFVSLAMRKQLKKFVKTGEPVLIHLYNDMSVIAIVSNLTLFTVTLEIVDLDEETWLAQEIMPIGLILGVCSKSVGRARRKLMIENGEDLPEECASETCEDE